MSSSIAGLTGFGWFQLRIVICRVQQWPVGGSSQSFVIGAISEFGDDFFETKDR